MSDVKIYHSKDAPGFRCVLESDWATERQAREKAEAERDAERQKVRELVKDVNEWLGGFTEYSVVVKDLRAILARHKEA